MTQFYCKYAHIQCASVCEENDELLTFTDSATHFVRSATGGTVRGGAPGATSSKVASCWLKIHF